MTEIDVAIAIVSYRCADLTIDCLRSIELECTTPGIRIRAIVVDNASGDAPAISEAIAANQWASWATLVEAPCNSGFAYGNNLAIARAFADGPPRYFHMLNPDTVARPGAIGELVRFLEAHPDVGIAGSSFETEDGIDWPYAFRFPSILGELEQGLQFKAATWVLARWAVGRRMPPAAQPTDWVSGASMMIRCRVFNTIGGLDENYFLYFEETDFCFRASTAGFTTWYVPASRVMHILGQSTKVTDRSTAAKRLPDYWFESRRRYFVVNHGLAYAIVADLVAAVAHSLGGLKRTIQGRRHRSVPYFIRDLLRHSPLRPTNRRHVAERRFSLFESNSSQERSSLAK